MRAWTLWTAVVLVTTAFAGCLGGEDIDEQSQPTDAAGITVTEVPADATLETIENGKRLVWESVSLPFEETIEIPPNTTLVQAHTELDGQPFVHLENADTGRRRCNVPYVTSWNEPREDAMTCSGLTAVDPLPAKWTVDVRGPGQTADLVTVDLLNVPIQGPAAKLNLSNLSMPTHELEETESVTITSHDGTELYAEVTLPKGEGPWPTVLASSPYNSGYHAAGEPSMWEYFTQDWAKRGYAVVNADVRGTGRSGGCMEVWGPNETQDQKVLVDWIAEQGWSDGHVGFYGQSYVGTTPTEAAVQAPEALDAIIAVAPVINAYDDWHFGGVPNGESVLSPAFYQTSTGGVSDLEMNDPAASAIQVANGVCDPALTARANDPRAVYDSFYEVRNFSQRADNVEAATLYTHGFEDVNVKSQMITHWFNGIDAPKLALLGHWVHQHPVRADNEVLFLAWMDEHVKGKAMGFEDVANVSVTTNDDHHRTGDTWPPQHTQTRSYYPDLTARELDSQPTDGSASILLDPAGLSGQAPVDVPGAIVLEGTVEETAHLAGRATVDLAVTLRGAENAHLAGFLYDLGPDGAEDPVLVSFGMANLAHRHGHDTYEPVPPNEVVRMTLPMLPTEHELSAGDEIQLVLRGAQTADWSAVDPGRPGTLTVHGGADGTRLNLATLDDPQLDPRPLALAP